jgi:hypothetical protein
MNPTKLHPPSRGFRRWLLPLLMLLATTAARVHAQAVAVTVKLDTNQIPVGGSTTLHVYAQVVPALRATSDRILSWYLDVVNTNGAAAKANYATMTRPSSDKDPQLSSTGVDQGANRRAIYDTFLNLAGAGIATPVELMSIPISGVAVGKTRLQVAAGSTVPQMGIDFLVAPKPGSTASQGGDYSAAIADLQVIGSSNDCQIQLQIVPKANNTQFQLTFTPCPGRDHFVETAPALGSPTAWVAVPGGPHNSGSVTVANTGKGAFFRVRVP